MSDMKKQFNILSLLMFAISLYGQKYSNEFLHIGIGARSLAMGNAVVVSTTGVYAGYWNPSALLDMPKHAELSLMHAPYFGGMAKYDYAAFAMRNTDSAALALSLIRFGVDDIPNTLDLVDANGNIDYNRIRSFSVADYAFLFSYARKIQNFNLGGNVKIIRRVVGEFASAWGFGIDLSSKYDINNWLLGLTIRDATSTFNAWHYNTQTFEEAFIKTGNEIPSDGLEISMPRIIIGLAREFTIKENYTLLAEINTDATFDRKRNTLIKSNIASFDPHVGIEASYKKIIFLRGGIFNLQYINDIDKGKRLNFQPSIGLGFQYRRFTLDYAFTDLGNVSAALYSHIISLKYCFQRIK